MVEKKKIGLVTIYQVPNYGSVLQTYATQILLEDNLVDCYIINYQYPNEWYFKKNKDIRPSIKNKIAQALRLKKHHRKSHKLEIFKKKNFNFTKKYNNLEQLERDNWDDYSAFVVGSDQVWNPRFTYGDSVFLLSFIPNNIFRFSIASSFASNSISQHHADKFKKYLNLFNYISVRERNGIKIINSDLEIKSEPKIILDPTLLLSSERWNSLFPTPKLKKKKKYILLYLLTYAFEPRPYVFDVLKYYQEKFDYDIIALEGFTSPNKANGIRMKDKTDASIPEFIQLFSNADMVVTSSFHGTAFALNFGIPLISIVPELNNDDRQLSLLNDLGLGQCIAKINSPFNELNPFYDIDIEQQKLRTLREDSNKWIKSVIENIK